MNELSAARRKPLASYQLVVFEANAMSDLAFVPLSPALESTQGIVWRKTLPTRQAQAFLDKLREVCAEAEDL